MRALHYCVIIFCCFKVHADSNKTIEFASCSIENSWNGNSEKGKYYFSTILFSKAEFSSSSSGGFAIRTITILKYPQTEVHENR